MESLGESGQCEWPGKSKALSRNSMAGPGAEKTDQRPSCFADHDLYQILKSPRSVSLRAAQISVGRCIPETSFWISTVHLPRQLGQTANPHDRGVSLPVWEPSVSCVLQQGIWGSRQSPPCTRPLWDGGTQMPEDPLGHSGFATLRPSIFVFSSFSSNNFNRDQ